MRLFGKRDKKKEPRKKKEFVICPHCYVDVTVEAVEKAEGKCPSCKGEIDLETQPRTQL